MKKRLIFVIFFMQFIYSYGNRMLSTGLVINEIQVANLDQFLDYSYNFGPWIELYNCTEDTIDIGGAYVSDNPNNLTKFQLPADYGTIQPHGYTVIFFDHNAADGEYGSKARMQVGFDLDEDGGTIYISNQDGELIIEQTYPRAITRCSYARLSDGADDWSYTGQPTLGSSNNNSLFSSSRLEAPRVDTDSKLFTEPFHVFVNIPEGSELRYTIDGATPTIDSPTSKDGVFQVEKTTILRLRLFSEDKLPSAVVTRSYIYKDNPYYLPVLSLTTNNAHLYSDSIGVYCKGTNGIEGRNSNGPSNINMDWERTVNVEFLTSNNQMVINQEAEFCVAGGWSRHYQPSSFKLKARNIYEGIKSFDYSLFPRKPYNKNKVLLVRNGGNDNDSESHGRIKDAIISQTLLTSGIYVDCQDYQPIHVFFNGNYIGLLNLREPSNKYYGVANYGIDKDNIDAYEYSNGYYQKAGDEESFKELYRLSELSSDEDAYHSLLNILDIDEYINYMAALIYISSADWILNNNNCKGFRNRDNGKYHNVLFDVEWGFLRENSLVNIIRYGNNDFIRIFNNLLKNSDIRKKFIDTYCLMAGSVFTPERSTIIADSVSNLVAPALAFEGKSPWYSYDELLPNMADREGINKRYEELESVFGLNDGFNLKVSSNHETVQLQYNGQEIPLGNYSGRAYPPVIISSSAPYGYKFVGWRDGQGNFVSYNEQLEINSSGEDLSLVACYAKNDYSLPIVINEISASNSIYVNDYQKKSDWIELYNMSSDSLDVSEMYLSDNLNTPYKYTIESAPGVNTIIPPYGFIIIWADKMEPISELHTSFKLKNENESYLILSSKDGRRSDVLKYNKHNGDESIGRYPNGGGEVYIMTKPTINNKNFKTIYSKLL